jgi:hypothetical protein
MGLIGIAPGRSIVNSSVGVGAAGDLVMCLLNMGVLVYTV